ncbi:hypothetical protein FB45DRAFT_1117081 [Roridomyces roridus]|uniref:Uncharacterized protein n=1 Tax=Roridomyces roridus TaxID=1738132 RepID=A0AAD7FAP1_9AGAR|nr:hypothetical protein FB45DRAFT_1117081 [Roridomyces roridus]
MFTPNPGQMVGITPCLACGCLGVQHLPGREAETEFKSSEPGRPNTFSAPSATAQTLFNSRLPPGMPPVGVTSAPPLFHTALGTSLPTSASAASTNPLSGSTAVPPVFRNLAQSRATTNASAALGSEPFNPAAKAKQEADLNIPGAKQRKRKASTKIPVDRPPPKSQSGGMKLYTAVLIPATKAVARRRGDIPDAAGLVDLAECDYVATIQLADNASPEEVKAALEGGFSKIAAVKKHGLRLLRTGHVLKKGKRGQRVRKRGVRRRLMPLKMSLSIRAVKMAQANSTVRKAGAAFKRSFFVSLPAHGPNLPFPGVFDADSDPDTDISSDETEGEGSDVEETMDSASDSDDSDASIAAPPPVKKTKLNPAEGSKPPPPKNTQKKAAESADSKGKAKPTKAEVRESAPVSSRKGKEKAKKPHEYECDQDEVEDPPFDFPAFDAADEEPVPPALTVPDVQRRAQRAVLNMHPPTQAVTWWTSVATGTYANAYESTANAAALCDMFLNRPGLIQASNVPDIIRSHILTPLVPFVELGSELRENATRRVTFDSEFTAAFALGPGGAHALLDHLSVVYRALPALVSAGIPHAEASVLRSELEDLSCAIFRCVQHLRSTLVPSAYDPPGFREFSIFLETFGDQLPVASEEAFRLLNLSILVNSITRPELNTADVGCLLMMTFDDMSDAASMRKERIVRGGEFGIGRVFNLLARPLLDEVDADNNEYQSTLVLMTGFFSAVTEVLRSSLDTEPEKPEMPSKSEKPSKSKPSSSGPNTRSRAKKRKSSSETGQPETNGKSTPSSDASGAKRKKSPPINLVSESESDSDSEWRRTYKKFKKSARPPTPPKPRPKPRPAFGFNSTASSSAPSRPQTRAAPAWLDSTSLEDDDVDDATQMAWRARYWQQLIRYILERFPHPDVTKRPAVSVVLSPGSNRNSQYRQMSLVCHSTLSSPAH